MRAFDEAPAVDYSGLQPDLLLTAIEGRAPADQRDARIQWGLGPAAVFDPAVVKQMDHAFRAVTPQMFAQHFSPEVMTAQMVEPEMWDEGDGLLDEFLRPAFERLRAFFGRAAAANQFIVVVYS